MSIVEGVILVRDFITFTVDKERTAIFNTTVRSNKPERKLTVEEIEEAAKNPESDIAKYGFAILYSFRGKVNDRAISFDNQAIDGKQPELKTLGYARASIIDGNKIYLTASFNDVPGYERPGCKYGEEGAKPDILGAIKLEELEDGATLKYRAFKEADTRFFPEKTMLNLYYEPGHFNKARGMILGDGMKKVQKRRGRKANPDKIEMIPLPDKEILSWINEMADSKSAKFSGFKFNGQSDRVITLIKEFDDSEAMVKVSTNKRTITILYMNSNGWKVYREWQSTPTLNLSDTRKDIQSALITLLAAYKD